MNYNNFQLAIPKIERIIGYTFRDKSLLTQAFTRTSFCNEHPREGYQSNEVLEFFGDGVLSVAIISFLLESLTERYRYGIRTELGEGDFSNIKSKLSDKTNLSRSLSGLGLQSYLLLGEGDAKLGISDEPSVMEDLFESIVGAVYIDSGKDLEKVTRVVANMLDMSVYREKSVTRVAPKNALQEWCSAKARRLPAPIYKTLGESGPDHKKLYERGVYIGERLVGRGTGKNMKLADSLAAEAALALLISEEEKRKPLTPSASDGIKSKADADGKAKSTAKPVGGSKRPAVGVCDGGKGKKTAKGAKIATKGVPGGKEPTVGAVKKSEGAKSTKIATKGATGGKEPTVGAVKKSEGAKSTKIATRGATGGKKPLSSEAKSKDDEAPTSGGGEIAKSLKERVATKGLGTLIWRDLGITRTHRGELEYRIECSCGARSTVGVGASRTDAREAAARAMLRLLGLR